jgi:hypothetical protein
MVTVDLDIEECHWAKLNLNPQHFQKYSESLKKD